MSEIPLVKVCLVQYTTCTFGPALSCNFKKLKVHETKLHLDNIFTYPKLNPTQKSYKKGKKFMKQLNMTTTSRNLSFCFIKGGLISESFSISKKMYPITIVSTIHAPKENMIKIVIREHILEDGVRMNKFLKLSHL